MGPDVTVKVMSWCSNRGLSSVPQKCWVVAVSPQSRKSTRSTPLWFQKIPTWCCFWCLCWERDGCVHVLVLVWGCHIINPCFTCNNTLQKLFLLTGITCQMHMLSFILCKVIWHPACTQFSVNRLVLDNVVCTIQWNVFAFKLCQWA
jgi:hypothetical protein